LKASKPMRLLPIQAQARLPASVRRRRLARQWRIVLLLQPAQAQAQRQALH